MIAGKSSDSALTEAMKAKYKLEKKNRGYAITNIKDKGVHVATQVMVDKVMIKCHTNEVPVPVVTLVEQCMEGIQFNWVEFLCMDFLLNCCKAQEQGKTFHYVWFILFILLVAGELPEDSQFPNIDSDLPEATKYASLWSTKDAKWICNTKIF